MRKFYKIVVPQSCESSWEQMTPVSTGRYCNSCEKTVVDFTEMSDEQIVRYFKDNAGKNVCGRFSNDQLDRPMREKRQKMPWLKYVLNISIPALLISIKSSAQQVKQSVYKEYRYTETDSGARVRTPVLDKKEISGIVTDENGTGIPYASVVIKNTTIGASADSAGFFRLEYFDKVTAIKLVISSVGYQDRELILGEQGSSQVKEIILEPVMLKPVTLEGVQIISRLSGRVGGAIAMRVTHHWYDTLVNVLPQREQIKIYPNPARRGNSVFVDIGSVEEDQKILEVYTINGQLIHRVDNVKTKIAKLDIPSLTTGVYVVSVRNKSNGKKISTKLHLVN